VPLFGPLSAAFSSRLLPLCSHGATASTIFFICRTSLGAAWKACGAWRNFSHFLPHRGLPAGRGCAARRTLTLTITPFQRRTRRNGTMSTERRFWLGEPCACSSSRSALPPGLLYRERASTSVRKTGRTWWQHHISHERRQAQAARRTTRQNYATRRAAAALATTWFLGMHYGARMAADNGMRKTGRLAAPIFVLRAAPPAARRASPLCGDAFGRRGSPASPYACCRRHALNAVVLLG